MKVKVESEKVGVKLNIQKTKVTEWLNWTKVWSPSFSLPSFLTI